LRLLLQYVARDRASAAALDALSAEPAEYYGRVPLRWVLVHMLEETARHAGHLDIMREAIDGKSATYRPTIRGCSVRTTPAQCRGPNIDRYRSSISIPDRRA
jgi:hypothetical protein